MQVIAAVTCQMLILYFWHFQNFISGYLQSKDPDNSHPWTSLGSQCNLRQLLSSQHQSHRYTVFLPHWPSFEMSQFCSHKVKGKKKHSPGWQFHWTEILCFNAQKQQILCLHDSGSSEASKATKSNSSNWLNVKCYTLVICNTNLLFCYGFDCKSAFNQVSVKKGKCTSSSVQSASACQLLAWHAYYIRINHTRWYFPH